MRTKLAALAAVFGLSLIVVACNGGTLSPICQSGNNTYQPAYQNVETDNPNTADINEAYKVTISAVAVQEIDDNGTPSNLNDDIVTNANYTGPLGTQAAGLLGFTVNPGSGITAQRVTDNHLPPDMFRLVFTLQIHDDPATSGNEADDPTQPGFQQRYTGAGDEVIPPC